MALKIVNKEKRIEENIGNNFRYVLSFAKPSNSRISELHCNCFYLILPFFHFLCNFVAKKVHLGAMCVCVHACAPIHPPTHTVGPLHIRKRISIRLVSFADSYCSPIERIIRIMLYWISYTLGFIILFFLFLKWSLGAATFHAHVSVLFPSILSLVKTEQHAVLCNIPLVPTVVSSTVHYWPFSWIFLA